MSYGGALCDFVVGAIVVMFVIVMRCLSCSLAAEAQKIFCTFCLNKNTKWFFKLEQCTPVHMLYNKLQVGLHSGLTCFLWRFLKTSSFCSLEWLKCWSFKVFCIIFRVFVMVQDLTKNWLRICLLKDKNIMITVTLTKECTSLNKKPLATFNKCLLNGTV